MKKVLCQLSALLVVITINLGLAPCASAQEVPKAQQLIAPAGTPPSVLGGKNIVIDITTQLLYLLEGNTSLMTVPCGTGSGLEKNLDTIADDYKITSKEGAGRKSHMYGNVPIPYAMRLSQTNVFIHGFEGFRSLRVDGMDIGIPQSHGCIRLKVEDAKKLSELVEIGTPVRIIGSTGEFVTESDIVRRLYDKQFDGSYRLKILAENPAAADIMIAREAFFNRQILIKGAKGKNPTVGMPFLPLNSMVSLVKFESIVLTEEEKREGKHLKGGVE